jgi:pimeloyl-ACP methyl ester carboxylesterase
MAVRSSSEYRFGPFRLEAAERRLWREDRQVPLQGKLFDLLLILVRNAGRLLEKETILRSVWPDTHVEETNLPHSVSILRKVLGETDDTRYVETVPKHGYRFVATVREVTSDIGGAVAPTPRVKPKIPSTRYVRAGDVTVAYQVCGDGPIDVVYVPGWITHLEYGWEQPRVAQLRQGIASFSRLLLFDKRGTGLSDRTHGYPTLDDRMDDVRAVMDAVKSERAVVFGASEGGGMSLLFAATHPDRTTALVLYGTFAKRVWSPDYPWAPTPEARQQWYELLERGWGGKTDLDSLAPSLTHDEAFAEWWSTYLRMGASPGAALALARFNTQIDTRDLLPAIQVPTLILHRTGDREVNIEEARYMAARIPRATLVELPGEDHLVYAGDVDRIVDEIWQFVATVRTGQPVERVLSTIAVLDAGDRDASHISTLVSHHAGLHRAKVVRLSPTQWLVSFDRPSRAIQAALAIVAAARQDGWALRAGIHTGECEIAKGRLEGPPVVAASELAAAAPEGSVLVTRTVTDLVAGSGIRFNARGEMRVGESGGWAVFEARAGD